MPRYPGLTWRPLPEDTTQPTAVKTQVILHSTADNGGPDATWQYFNRPDIYVESTFVVGFDGGGYQMLDSNRRADANVSANTRAISIETVGAADRPWTPQQLDRLADIARWANTTHGIPLTVPPAHDQPGIGYHRMFPQWSPSGTACPNDLRVAQFHNLFIPMIQGVDMPLTPEDLAAIQKLLVEVSVSQGYAGGAQQDAAAMRTEGVSGAADLARQIADQLKSHMAAAGGVDTAALAQQVADLLAPKVAGAVADELSRRLTA